MKAIVIGATGLVGKSITELLLAHTGVSSVQIFVRRKSGLVHSKLQETVVDFEKLEEWRGKVLGDVLFSALGTTLKVAGSREAQYRIDHDYQLLVATAAAQNGVRSYALVSSVNADPKSKFFYLRMKGELDEAVKTLGFKSITILRPGPLKGDRERPRLGEVVATKILSVIPESLVGASIRPVEARKVAEKAIKAALKGPDGIHVLEAKTILKDD